ncbi:MAG: hypothetical protein WCG87_06225 [Bacteroidota bacterium]
MVTWENYEEYMLLYADRELSDVQQQQLMDFIALHTELQQELDMYDATRLIPVTEEVYTDKESLLKSLPVKRSISLRRTWVYSAAAVMLLLASIGIFRWGQNTGTQQINVAQVPRSTKPSASIDTPQQNSTVPIQQKETAPIVVEQKEKHNAASEKQSNQGPTTPSITKQAIAHEPILVKNESIEKINIVPVQVAKVTIAVEHKAVEIPVASISRSEVKVANNPTVNKTNKKYNYLLASLPFSKERRKGLNELKNAVANGVQQVRTASYNLKASDLRLKIGNKDVLVVKL